MKSRTDGKSTCCKNAALREFHSPPLNKMASSSGAKKRWRAGLLFFWFLFSFFSVAQASEFAVPGKQEPLNVATTARPPAVQWDPKGYVVFCLCMGECTEGRTQARYGMQQEEPQLWVLHLASRCKSTHPISY